MARTVFKTIAPRHSAVPRKRAGSSASFSSMLLKLSAASAKLEKSRRR
ncbi:MAG TPA: hypothetical protein VGN72_07345 [Tepidisphaeraceae bacterium]|jgi:hypothetical protein|nr:hypothetical protein [Tepidisphaeraceae bacterium]